MERAPAGARPVAALQCLGRPAMEGGRGAMSQVLEPEATAPELPARPRADPEKQHASETSVVELRQTRRDRALARFHRLDRKRRRYAAREAFGLWRRAWMDGQVALQRAAVHWKVQCVVQFWRRWRTVREAAVRRAEEEVFERAAAAAARQRRDAEVFWRGSVLRRSFSGWHLEARDATLAKERDLEHRRRRQRLLQAVAERVKKQQQQEEKEKEESVAIREAAAPKPRTSAGARRGDARGCLWKRKTGGCKTSAERREPPGTGAAGGTRATDTWVSAPRKGASAPADGGRAPGMEPDEEPLLQLTDSAELELGSILSRHRHRCESASETAPAETRSRPAPAPPRPARGATGMEARTLERKRRREELKRRYAEAAELRRSEYQARETRIEAEAAAQHEELLGSRRRARQDAELERQERECRATLAREQLRLGCLHRNRVLARSHGGVPWTTYMAQSRCLSERARCLRPRALLRVALDGLRVAVIARRRRAVLLEVERRGTADAMAWRNRAARGLQAFMFHFILCFSKRQAELHYSGRLLLAGLRGLAGACAARRTQMERAAEYCRFRRLREPLVGWFLCAQRAREDWRRQEASLLFRAAAWAKHHAQWRAFHSWRRRLRSRRLRRFIADFHEDLFDEASPAAGERECDGERPTGGGAGVPAGSVSAVSEELRALEAEAAAPFEEIGAVLAALDKDIAAVWHEA